MIVFLLLFIGLPIAMTLVFGDKDRTIAYWMPMSLVIIFVLWTVISLPCVLMQTKFHIPLYIFIVVMVLFAGFMVFMLIKRRRIVIKKIKCFFSSDAKKYFTNVFFIVMAILVLYQAGRATIFEPIGFSDSKTYIALANDIVETDSFYTIDDETGAEIGDTKQVSTKYLLSGWYSFEALLSVLFNKAPTITIITILPGFLIILSYMVWWCISKQFFDNDIKKMSLFSIIMFIIYECLTDYVCDTTAYLIWFPTWGKSVASKIIVPLVIYVWLIMAQQKKKSIGSILEIILLVIAGCSASNMGFMIIPMELGLLTVAEFVVKRKFDIYAIVRFAVMVLPVAVYSTLYFIYN